MCPEKERYDREDKRRLSYYEMVPGTENIVSLFFVGVSFTYMLSVAIGSSVL